MTEYNEREESKRLRDLGFAEGLRKSAKIAEKKDVAYAKELLERAEKLEARHGA